MAKLIVLLFLVCLSASAGNYVPPIRVDAPAGGGGGGDLTEVAVNTNGGVQVASGTGPIPSVGLIDCATGQCLVATATADQWACGSCGSWVGTATSDLNLGNAYSVQDATFYEFGPNLTVLDSSDDGVLEVRKVDLTGTFLRTDTGKLGVWNTSSGSSSYGELESDVLSLRSTSVAGSRLVLDATTNKAYLANATQIGWDSNVTTSTTGTLQTYLSGSVAGQTLFCDTDCSGAFQIRGNDRGTIGWSADGRIQILNNAGTGADGVTIGTETASGVRLARSSGTLSVLLGNGSSGATLEVDNIQGFAADLNVTDNLVVTGTIRSTATATIGWSVVLAANQACTTTCTNACVNGQDTDAVPYPIIDCADATADRCVCAGAN